MSTDDNFRVAMLADRVGSWIFWSVAVVSALLLFWPGATIEAVLHPILITAAISGIGASVVTAVFQTEGNRLLRASQLSVSLGASIGEAVRDDYYNNTLPNSLARLAATTLENALHTSRALADVLWRERATTGGYVLLFVLLMAYRRTSLSWLLLFAQTLFSADVVLRWFRLERLQFRTCRVREHLRQFFLQGGRIRTPNGTAIALAAFADYECAKDEAALPLDSRVFHKQNAAVSAEWEQMKVALKIN